MTSTALEGGGAPTGDAALATARDAEPADALDTTLALDLDELVVLTQAMSAKLELEATVCHPVFAQYAARAPGPAPLPSALNVVDSGPYTMQLPSPTAAAASPLAASPLAAAQLTRLAPRASPLAPRPSRLAPSPAAHFTLRYAPSIAEL